MYEIKVEKKNIACKQFRGWMQTCWKFIRSNFSLMTFRKMNIYWIFFSFGTPCFWLCRFRFWKKNFLNCSFKISFPLSHFFVFFHFAGFFFFFYEIGKKIQIWFWKYNFVKFQFFHNEKNPPKLLNSTALAFKQPTHMLEITAKFHKSVITRA